MKRFFLLKILLLALLLGAAPAFAQFRVIGYLPSWTGDVNAVQYDKLTHINYAFLLPNADGTLRPIENPDKLRSLVSAAHARGVKVLISVGGWLDGNPGVFVSIGNNAGYTRAFASNLVNFANQYNLDGIDIDWEYPDAGSSNGFAAVMRELDIQAHSQGKLVTAAVGAGSWGGGNVPVSSFGSVDFLNIMAYDDTPPNHSTYNLAAQAIAYWKGRGLPASKTVLGVPFYGQSGGETYVSLLARGADPNADLFQGIGYNGIPTIKSKTNLAFDQASGIMIWQLAGDATGASSLLTAINQVVRERGGTNPPPVGGDPNLSGIYKLQNRNSGLFLDVDGASQADRAPLIQWTGNDCTCQQFRFTHLGNGTYTIQAVHSGKVLDVNEISTAAGAAIVQWPSAGGANQQFTALSTGNGFYKLRAKHSGQLIEVAGASTAGRARVQQQPDNGASCQQWQLVRAGDPSTSFSTTIQAEAFSNMQGVQVEGTSDAGGGQNVGYIDATDWLAYYNINFPTSGQYTIEYRVASLSGSRLSADLNGGAIQLGTVNLPATGGWQSWATVSQTVNINAGTYNFGVYAQAGGWNLNWIRISKAGSARAAAITTQATLSTEEAVDVYPNPVGSQLLLRSARRLVGSQYEVLDAYGQAQASGILGEAGIDVAKLRGGVYTLRLITPDNQRITRRLLKQ